MTDPEDALYNLDFKRYKNSLLQEQVASWIGLCAIIVVIVVVLVIVFGLLTGYFHASNSLTVTLISSLMGVVASTILGVVLFKLIREFSSRTEKSHKVLLEDTKKAQKRQTPPRVP